MDKHQYMWVPAWYTKYFNVLFVILYSQNEIYSSTNSALGWHDACQPCKYQQQCFHLIYINNYHDIGLTCIKFNFFYEQLQKMLRTLEVWWRNIWMDIKDDLIKQKLSDMVIFVLMKVSAAQVPTNGTQSAFLKTLFHWRAMLLH